MKLKQGTDLTKYGFKQWASGIWYLPCNVLETNAEDNNLTLIVEDNELRLYEHTVENDEFESIFEIPSVLTKMIKDEVVV